jgi:hypothetical protein
MQELMERMSWRPNRQQEQWKSGRATESPSQNSSGLGKGFASIEQRPKDKSIAVNTKLG